LIVEVSEFRMMKAYITWSGFSYLYGNRKNRTSMELSISNLSNFLLFLTE